MTEEEKATAPTAEKWPKDCKTCHSAGHIGPVCADCIESAYRHYTPEAPEGDGAEEGEELAALLITLDDAVGDLEADGNPEYAEAIKQARHILTVLTQPKEPEAEASREALIDRIADLERALQAERGAYDDLAAFTASLPAPVDEKALRAPRGDGSGGWILDYDYLILLANPRSAEGRERQGGRAMSYTCRNCGTTIMEDDENLCSKCKPAESTPAARDEGWSMASIHRELSEAAERSRPVTLSAAEARTVLDTLAAERAFHIEYVKDQQEILRGLEAQLAAERERIKAIETQRVNAAEAEASGENATVAKIGEIIIAYHEDSENWDQAIYHIRLALRECIPRPAPTDEKGPKGYCKTCHSPGHIGP